VSFTGNSRTVKPGISIEAGGITTSAAVRVSRIRLNMSKRFNGRGGIIENSW
jgi:hypothetical protein